MSEFDNQEHHEAVVEPHVAVVEPHVEPQPTSHQTPVPTPTPVPTTHPVVVDPVEVVPATPVSYKGTPEAGLQRIRAGITLLETHSAARVAGSLISDALQELEIGYSVLLGNHPVD